MAQFLEAAKIEQIYVPERMQSAKGPCFALPHLRSYLYEGKADVTIPPEASADAGRFFFKADGRFSALGEKAAFILRCVQCRAFFFSCEEKKSCPLCFSESKIWAKGSDGIPGWDGQSWLFDPDEFEKKLASLPEGDGLSEKMRKVASLLSGSPREATLTQEKARLFGELSKNYPNMKEPLRYFRASLVRTKLRRSKAISFRPMLLVGPPGSGKSAFAAELGRIVSGREPLRVDLGNDVASFTLAGSDMSWRKSKCGLVLQSMFRVGSDGPLKNPVVILDELDKIPPGGSHDVEGVFYSILERETAERFRDNYFDVAVDASGINYIATANDSEKIPPAILSRFESFEIRAYTEKEFLERVIPHFYARWIEFERIDRASVPASLSAEIRLRVLSECKSDTRRVSAAFDRVLEATGRIDRASGRFIAFFSEDELKDGWKNHAGRATLPSEPFFIS